MRILAHGFEKPVAGAFHVHATSDFSTRRDRRSSTLATSISPPVPTASAASSVKLPGENGDAPEQARSRRQ